MRDKLYYFCEEWSGDSKDGVIINGEGFHFFQMTIDGYINEAYEVYESEEGDEIVTPLPEMTNISWTKDLGFENMEALDKINKMDFQRIKSLMPGNDVSAKNI